MWSKAILAQYIHLIVRLDCTYYGLILIHTTLLFHSNSLIWIVHTFRLLSSPLSISGPHSIWKHLMYYRAHLLWNTICTHHSINALKALMILLRLWNGQTSATPPASMYPLPICSMASWETICNALRSGRWRKERLGELERWLQQFRIFRMNYSRLMFLTYDQYINII